MEKAIFFIAFVFLFSACSEKRVNNKSDFVIAHGQMPWITKGNDNNLDVVYGIGDSIMFTFSSDNANTFSKPTLISALPHVYTFATRGPQIAANQKGEIITACTSTGDIYSFYKEKGEGWRQGNKVNDVDAAAKEGLMALSADGENAFAVWLDLRGNNKNKIYGAKSIDGGKTWSKNIMIYTSPDTSVCECCKPSVIVKGNNVYVMFRNWLRGNRDLYMIQSTDGGNTFGQAQKLGTGSWPLNGCPMDGGALSVKKNGDIQTVWRREGKIYTAVPGSPEKEIGTGKGCTIETLSNKNFYVWTENGDIVFINAQEQKKIIGKGSQPVLKALGNRQLICVWEDKKEIHASVIVL